jgi:hypothetical protein
MIGLLLMRLKDHLDAGVLPLMKCFVTERCIVQLRNLGRSCPSREVTFQPPCEIRSPCTITRSRDSRRMPPSEWIFPRTSGGGEHLLDSHSLKPFRQTPSMRCHRLSIAIFETESETRRLGTETQNRTRPIRQAICFWNPAIASTKLELRPGPSEPFCRQLR